jgi:hypothetical protein
VPVRDRVPDMPDDAAKRFARFSFHRQVWPALAHEQLKVCILYPRVHSFFLRKNDQSQQGEHELSHLVHILAAPGSLLSSPDSFAFWQQSRE